MERDVGPWRDRRCLDFRRARVGGVMRVERAWLVRRRREAVWRVQWEANITRSSVGKCMVVYSGFFVVCADLFELLPFLLFDPIHDFLFFIFWPRQNLFLDQSGRLHLMCQQFLMQLIWASCRSVVNKCGSPSVSTVSESVGRSSDV